MNRFGLTFLIFTFFSGFADFLRAEDSPQVEDVWVVFKTHFDLGYTDRVSNVLTRYRVEMMENALKVIEGNRNLPPEKRFAWTVAGWPMSHILGPQQEPARRERIVQALKEGSLVVHALPGTLHTESFDMEDLVRGMSFSSKIARQYGLPMPISAKMTDVPEHSWVMPTLLANAGVKFLQIGCNSGSQYPRFPLLFWWEGPDGSRILCNYTRDYGSHISPPKDWPSKHYLAMIMTSDNEGPPHQDHVDKIRKEFEKQMPGVKVHFGTLDDFTKAVLKEKPNLPVVRSDTPDTWIHGLLSMPIESKIARNIRPLEPVLDELDTHLRLWGLTPDSLAQSLDDAYENSFLYGEHTWGMNGAYGGRSLWGDDWKNKLPVAQQKNFLASFDDHRNYIRKTEKIVSRELQSRLELLAKSVNSDGRRIVVYNPLPWPRSGFVQVDIQGGKVYPLTDLATGKTLSGDWNGKQYVFYASDVPAGGYKTYQLPSTSKWEPGPIDPAPGNTLETPFFKVVFDLQRGGISSLIEKSTGRELVDRASPYAIGQFLHERFSLNQVNQFVSAYGRGGMGWVFDDFGKPGMPDANKSPYLAISPSDWKLAYSHSPDADIVTLKAGDSKGLAKGCSLTFTFPKQSPWIDIEWQVLEKTPNKIPEGGWLCFPFSIENPQFTVGRPGAPIDPAQEIVPGSNRHLYAVSSGVAISDPQKSGVALCPVDSPLISLDQPGLWKFSMDFIPSKPSVFVNLYNNMWNTNFPLWIEGSWSERVRIWPIASSEESIPRNLAVQSWETRTPLVAAYAFGDRGPLPTTASGLRLSRPGVLVTAFGTDPDGNHGTLLRLWDQSGISGELTVSLPKDCKAILAQPVNLRGEKTGDALRINEGQFTINLKQYAPASFLLMNP